MAYLVGDVHGSSPLTVRRVQNSRPSPCRVTAPIGSIFCLASFGLALLMAEREGRPDLLSHFGLTQDGGRLSVQRDTPLRRLVKSVAALRSA